MHLAAGLNSCWQDDLLSGLKNENIHSLFYTAVDKYNIPIIKAKETLTAKDVTRKQPLF
jgi:hypothetical protein